MEKCGLKKDDGKSFRNMIFQEITGTHVFSRIIFRNLHDLFDRAECSRNTVYPHMLVDNNAEHVDDDASKSGVE